MDQVVSFATRSDINALSCRSLKSCDPVLLNFKTTALRSSALPWTGWHTYDADIRIEILLGRELAIAEDHSADERPDQKEAHAERGGNQSKWHGDLLAVASCTPLTRASL
jgi:hypothetical protein